MRGDPPTVLQAVIANAVVLVTFVVVAIAMVRRARDPDTVPRDEFEARVLPRLRRPTNREKIWFLLLLAVGIAAPWLTRYFAG